MFFKHPIKAFVFFFCATHCQSQIRLGCQTMVKENNVLKYEPIVGSYFRSAYIKFWMHLGSLESTH